MLPSYHLSIETPTPLVLGVGVFFAPVTSFVTFVLFGRRLSGNFCVEEYLHCVRRLHALLFLLRRLPPLAETSSGVSLPGTSSSSLPLGGRGRQEGSQGAPGVLSGGASSPPARSQSSGRGGGASGLLSGARSLFSFSFGSGRGGGCPLAVGFLFSALLTSLSLPNSHRTFHDVRIRGRLRSLASAYYPPVVLVLRIVKHGWIRGPGHVGVARGYRCGCRSRSSSRSRSRGRGRRLQLSSAWLSSRARSRSSDRYLSRRGGSRSRCDRSRSLDRYQAHRDRLWRDRWWSVDRSRSRHQRTRFPCPLGRSA